MKTITLTDKDFGRLTFQPHQITKIEFNLSDRLGIGVTVVDLPDKHFLQTVIVPVEPREVKEMFRILGEQYGH
jgi:hypothetical protein